MTQPDISLFHIRGREPGSGKWQRFVRTLEVNVPVPVPGAKSTADNYAKQLRHVAQAAGLHIALRTYEGRVWVCLLSDKNGAS